MGRGDLWKAAWDWPFFFFFLTFTSRTPWALKGYRCKEWSSPLSVRRGGGWAGEGLFFKIWDWGLGRIQGGGSGMAMLNEEKRRWKGATPFHDWLRPAGVRDLMGRRRGGEEKSQRNGSRKLMRG